jgi:hypothetical protein
MKILCSIFTGILLVRLVNGCTRTYSAKEALDVAVYIDSQGKLKLIDFKKIDGQETEISGVRHYNLRYAAEIEIEETGTWQRGTDGVDFCFSTTQSPVSPMANLGSTIEKAVAVTAGEHVKIGGILAGETLNNDWQFFVSELHVISNQTPKIIYHP